MAWTFGAGAGDDISFTCLVAPGASARVSFHAGWFYPTTLTAGRVYFGSGTVFVARVDTTTSELRMITNNATTQGEWVTSGAAIAINQWHFIAWLNTCLNTGPALAWRTWVGIGTAPPAEVTCTQAVTPVGNFTGSTAYCIGNRGTSGTVAFQGDIGAHTLINTTAGINLPLYVETSGVITQSEADAVFARWVIPIWKGRPDPMFAPAWTAACGFQHCPLDISNLAYAFQWDQTVVTPITLTPTGATISGSREPIVCPPAWPLHAPTVRR